MRRQVVMMRVVVLLTIVARFLCTDAVAFAQEPPPDPDSAQHFAEIKKRGDDAMDAHKPDEALVAYTEAYAIKPEPALQFNKGRALQMLGQYPKAITELEAFEKAASPEVLARVPGLAKMLTDLRQHVTQLVFACDVDGAEIRVRGESIGKCPMRAPYVANSGDARVEVIAANHFPWHRDLPLPPGGVAAIEVHLVSRATSGVLVVKSSTPFTTVVVDGNRVGNAPVEVPVTNGAHAVEVSAEGYRTSRVEANVLAGETKEMTLTLDSNPSIFSRWWFWTGVGVVIAGGITTGILLSADKDPTPGTLGVVQGGLRF